MLAFGGRAVAQSNTFPASGNVGIGTTSPFFALDVNNNNYNTIRAIGNSTNCVGIYVADTTSSGRQWGLLSSGGNVSPVGSFTIWDDTAQLARLTINSTGYVGIGTSAPGNALAVTGEISASSGFRIWNGDNGDDVNTAPWYGLGISNLKLAGASSPAVQLAGFYGLNIVTQSGQMVVTQSGNVGIGTSAPTAPLQIVAPAGNSVPVIVQSPTPNSYVCLQNSGGSSSISSTNNDLYIGGGGTAGSLYFRNSWNLLSMIINPSGNVGIGTGNPTYPLSVNGTIEAKEVLVQTGWSDYVFDRDYHLESLQQVQRDIDTQHHLSGIPSADDVAKHGVSMGEMEAKLLAKVEELTLHAIDQERRLDAQAAKIQSLEAQISALTGKTP